MREQSESEKWQELPHVVWRSVLEALVLTNVRWPLTCYPYMLRANVQLSHILLANTGVFAILLPYISRNYHRVSSWGEAQQQQIIQPSTRRNRSRYTITFLAASLTAVLIGSRMKTYEIDNYQAFEELYNKYQRSGGSDDQLKNLILLFEASDDPQTKQCWCNDCKITKPIIMQTIEKFKTRPINLAIIQVGQRDEWKNPENPYRRHQLQVSAVPTMIGLKTVSFLYRWLPHDYFAALHVPQWLTRSKLLLTSGIAFSRSRLRGFCQS